MLHSLVAVLAAYAFVALGYIYDVPLAELYLETDDLGKFERSASLYQVDPARVDKFVLVQRLAPFAGALFGLALSFIAVRRKNPGLRLTLIVLVITIVLAASGALEVAFLRNILFAPGRLVSSEVMTSYTLNYLLLLSLSFWVAFLSKRTLGSKSKA